MKHLTIVVALSWVIPCSANSVANAWLDHCSRCHGEAGRGDTPLGKKLKIKDYSLKSEQAKFTDKQIVEIILKGKIENGKKVMPAYSEELSKETIESFVPYVRGMAKR